MQSLSIFPSTAPPCHFLFKDDNRDPFFLTFRQIHLPWMYLTTPPQSFFPLWPCLCWRRGSLPLSPFSLLLSFCWTVIISSTTSIPGPQWFYRGSVKFYRSSRFKDISIFFMQAFIIISARSLSCAWTTPLESSALSLDWALVLDIIH